MRKRYVARGQNVEGEEKRERKEQLWEKKREELLISEMRRKEEKE